MRRCVLLFLFVFMCNSYSFARACGVGSSNEYQIIQNPVFTFEISPPVAWTYFPFDATLINYFIGQSNTSEDATTRAHNEIIAGMTQALVDANMLVRENTIITDNYAPISVENIQAGATSIAGHTYGKVEGGAVIGRATTTANTAFAMIVFTTYTFNLQVTVRNLETTRYNWNIVKNNFLQKMTQQFHVKFYDVGTISDY